AAQPALELVARVDRQRHPQELGVQVREPGTDLRAEESQRRRGDRPSGPGLEDCEGELVDMTLEDPRCGQEILPGGFEQNRGDFVPEQSIETLRIAAQTSE